MTKRGLFEVGCKILGLYLLILCLGSFVGFLEHAIYFKYTEPDFYNQNLLFLLSDICRIALFGFGFWILVFKSAILSQKLIRQDSENLSLTISKTDLSQVMFCVAGIIISFFALSETWDDIIISSIMDFDHIPKEYLSQFMIIRTAVPLTKLFIGLSLVFFSRFFSRLLSRK